MTEWRPRNLVGYGEHVPDAQWPAGARIALSFCLNYEEGGEYSVEHGDEHSESYLSEVFGRQPAYGKREVSIESEFEYGSRAGVWRIIRLFQEVDMRFTVWAVGKALELNPQVGRRFAELGHEVAGHGWRWITYGDMPEQEEEKHCAAMFDVIKETTGAAPRGYYIGRHTTRTLAILAKVHADRGAPFLYTSDAYNDDLPYWTPAPGRDGGLLVVPYSCSNNDAKFGWANGFGPPDDLYEQLRSEFDMLYDEGGRMMSVGLHCRFAGKAARAWALKKFLKYVRERIDRDGYKVWVATRSEIAQHWASVHPYKSPSSSS